jgi:tetratricopeptide (TPR) repeat protein
MPVIGSCLRRLVPVCCALVLLTGAAASEAAPRKPPAARSPSDPKQAKIARAHFDKAEKAFDLGRFEEALTEYQSAYEALPLPGFVFNLAQCYRNLGDDERAIFFYQRYLTLQPDAPNRPVVEQLIAEQHRRQDVRQAAARQATADLKARAAPETPRPDPLRLAADPAPAHSGGISPRWLIVGTLGVAFLGGVTLLLLRGGGSAPTGELGVIDAR